MNLKQVQLNQVTLNYVQLFQIKSYVGKVGELIFSQNFLVFFVLHTNICDYIHCSPRLFLSGFTFYKWRSYNPLPVPLLALTTTALCPHSVLMNSNYGNSYILFLVRNTLFLMLLLLWVAGLSNRPPWLGKCLKNDLISGAAKWHTFTK
jgi:hypothetical protein